MAFTKVKIIFPTTTLKEIPTRASLNLIDQDRVKGNSETKEFV